MTCIVGFEDKGRVYIGGDSCGSNLYNYSIVTEPKVFIKEDFIIGYTHTFRFGQLLQYKMRIPKRYSDDKRSDYEYLVSDFVEAMRKCLKENGAAEIDKSIESGGDCLIGYRGCLYRIQSDFSVIRNNNGINAVGCGGTVAKTVMMVITDKTLGLFSSTEDILDLALHYVCRIDSHVRPPFTILSL